ncbi:MAG: TRAP transporter substrate-binding protein [Deltaproteobacteria bacterium]|nr:TRAP transporter substrate-binding protein [Deltaproteobacteria bacterium]
MKWIEAVEKETNGRITFKIYNSESLGKAKENFNLVRTGVADVTGIVQAYTPGYFPLTEIATLPYPVPGKSFALVAKAMWELHKRGLLDEKYKEVKVLALDPTEENQLFLKKKIMSMDEFKGLKIRSAGSAWADIIKAIGAIPIPLPITEAYLGLQRGMIDGLFHNWAAAPDYKTYEVVKYVLETDLGCAPLALLMNLKTWESLPPDIKKIIDNINERFVGWMTHGSPDKTVIGYELLSETVAKPLYKSHGVIEYKLPPQELAKFQQALISIWDIWIKEMEGKGLPAKKTVEAYLSILKRLGAEPIYKPTWK